MNREKDWMEEGEAKFRAARHLLDGGFYAWCCFISQQAAEKALKAALEHFRDPMVGHNMNELVVRLERHTAVAQSVKDACTRLNKLYILPRYPDAFPSGAPAHQYSLPDAQQALADAEGVISFVKTVVP